MLGSETLPLFLSAHFLTENKAVPRPNSLLKQPRATHRTQVFLRGSPHISAGQRETRGPWLLEILQPDSFLTLPNRQTS